VAFLNPGFVLKNLLMKPLPFNVIPPPVLSAPLEASAYTSLHWKGYAENVGGFLPR